MDPVTIAVVGAILVSGGIAAWKAWKKKNKTEALETAVRAVAEAATQVEERRKKGPRK